MIDKKIELYPDMDQMLVTCKKDPTIEEYNLCIKSFPYLLKQYNQKGYVEDKVFEELGFPMDEDENGMKIRRDAGITQESRQRAKALTHAHQVELHTERKTQKTNLGNE